ncbi:glycosyltransferase [Roseovarius pelagicus]|uniref:Glycosyltransferase n=1 Tax=Roseovarius pelagicus TaxID=2980108 RepID=A0ABY6DBL6_9RHOB|nr:glycosyltransferase [Roseovarius pelagicus]UXX83512.1 glycosyltransferase [Roseovarius pelagicus]
MTELTFDLPAVDAVVIGRNEGARLEACLASLRGQVRQLVYVDSGSTDGSVALAEQMGAEVVLLAMTQPFTAARARNAGLDQLNGHGLVMLVDGDCRVQPDWIHQAAMHLAAHPQAAVVCGRRREADPQASVYNRLIDREWAGPSGQVNACGGDAMMRQTALREVGGYNPRLIAGEEPDLCLRLRRAGWQIWRIDAEMTLHDAAISRLGQWWRRTKRAGHAYAEGAALHGASPDRHWVTETRRALFWGTGLPVVIFALSFVSLHTLWLLLAYPLQVCRIAMRRGTGWDWAFFMVLGKFAEAQGAMGYYFGRLRGRKTELIEYK